MANLLQVFDSKEESILEINQEFIVINAMPQAESIIRFYFPTHAESARLPIQLESWLKKEIANLAPYGPSTEKMVTSSFNRCSRKLIVIAFVRFGTGVMTISFKEDPVALENYRALVDHLTRRQTEVFHLLADGMRDIHAIAAKLGISYRTVEEHRRIINQKAKSIHPSILH